jgi:putative transposase
VRKPRIDRGRRRKLSAALQEAIEGLALKRPPLSIKVVCNQAKLLADGLGEKAPAYNLVYDVVSRLPADLVALAHQSSKACGNSFDLIYRREAAHSNAIWQADHTLLDIELLQSDVDSAMTAKRVFEKSHAGAIRFSIRRIEARSIIVSEVCTRYS